MKSTATTHCFKIAFTIRLIVILFLALILFAIAPGHAPAATYYVDKNHRRASDSNPGTEALPWKTISKAAATLVAGDTVFVKAGIYTASGGDWNTPDINPAHSGQPGNPIAFRVFPGDTVNVTGTMGSQYRDYIIIDGFTISGGKHIIVFGAGLSRIKGVIIENNTVSGLVGSGCGNLDGIRLQNTTGVIVRNNKLFNIHSTPKGCDGVGVRMYANDNAILENNEVYDVADGLYDKDNGDSNIFRYNYVHDCLRVGIRIASHNGHTIRDDKAYGNIVIRCRTGITSDGSSNSPNINTEIYNNTVDDSGIGVASDITNTQVWNNILYGASISGSNPSLGYCDYNLYHLASSGCGSNSITADPQFVSTSFENPADFKLQASSPAKGAGRNGEDIGAYTKGHEVIGLGVNIDQPDRTPPAVPTGLTVVR